jgi:hypothetical protein
VEIAQNDYQIWKSQGGFHPSELIQKTKLIKTWGCNVPWEIHLGNLGWE